MGSAAAGQHATYGAGARIIGGLGAVIAGYLILVPLAILLVAALRGTSDYLPFEAVSQWTVDNLRAVYGDPVLYSKIIPQTLTFALGAAVSTFAVGFALAWLVERTDLAGRSGWFWVIVSPLVLPTPILAIAWIFLFGPNAGWVNVTLRALLPFDAAHGPVNVFSMPGLILCQTLASVPFVFLLLTASLRSMDRTLEDVSAASGATAWTTLRRVTLPVLLPGMLAPFILVLLITLEQFELPLIIGLPAQINVFAQRIFWELSPPDGLPHYGIAAALALPFLAAGVLLLSLYNGMTKKAASFVTITGRAYATKPMALGKWQWPALLFAGSYCALAALLPAAVLLWTSFSGHAQGELAASAAAGLRNYRDVFEDSRFWLGLRNTILVAGTSALLGTAIGAMQGWLSVRSDFKWRHTLDYLSFMSIGIPAVINALAVMLLYLSMPIGVYGTVWILILAYSYRIAIATRIARVGLLQIQPELEQASAASGASWLTTQRRITAPLMQPHLFAAFLLLLVVGVREFTMPLVLYSPDNVVLSVLLLQLYQRGEGAQAAALATLMIVLIACLVFAARRYLGAAAHAR
jgi:iron(III) transport system permease protein